MKKSFFRIKRIIMSTLFFLMVALNVDIKLMGVSIPAEYNSTISSISRNLGISNSKINTFKELIEAQDQVSGTMNQIQSATRQLESVKSAIGVDDVSYDNILDMLSNTNAMSDFNGNMQQQLTQLEAEFRGDPAEFKDELDQSDAPSSGPGDGPGTTLDPLDTTPNTGTQPVVSSTGDTVFNDLKGLSAEDAVQALKSEIVSKGVTQDEFNKQLENMKTNIKNLEDELASTNSETEKQEIQDDLDEVQANVDVADTINSDSENGTFEFSDAVVD